MPKLHQTYRDTGVILRTYKLREADRIVVVLTEEHGKVRAVARGVRKTTSKFGARLEPMSHVRIQMIRGRELDTIAQVDSVEPLSPLFGDLDRASQGLAVLEAVDQVTLEHEPMPDVYRMLVGALRTIATRRSSLIVPAFLFKLLTHEGVGPQLEQCVHCGLGEPDVEIVSFDVMSGGVRCRNCRGGASISPDALAMLRDVLGGRLNAALDHEDPRAAHEVAALGTRAFEHHAERRLRAVAVFERQ